MLLEAGRAMPPLLCMILVFQELKCVCLNNISTCCLQMMLIFRHMIFDLHWSVFP